MQDILFPVPRSCRFYQRHFDFSSARWIHIDPAFSPVLKSQVIDFAHRASPAFVAALTVSAGPPQHGRLFLKMTLATRGIPAQGYELTADEDGVMLNAGDEAGAFYGLATLRQLLDHYGVCMPRFRIADHPDYPQRSVMLDISRCKVPTMESLKSYIDLMARLKINQLQLRTEHTFAFSAHEVVWRNASPMTAAEIIELDAYCRQRHIELVPHLSSFSHFQRWLQHPEYYHLAEVPGGSVPRPNRNTLNLLHSLYSEFLPNFSSTLFNVACDEANELGTGWSEKLCAQKGQTRVYLDFLLKIHRLVKKHQRRMMFWGDIILHQPNLIAQLPRDITALNWGYESDHPFNRQAPLFARSGIPFYVCPGTSSWQSITGRAPNCLGNLANAARNGLKHGADGYFITDWGDFGHHQLQPISYLGIAAGAAYSWSFKSNRDADIIAALNRLVFRDSTGATAQLLYDLGSVYQLLPNQPQNRTVFYTALFWDMENPDNVLSGNSAQALKKCARRFDDLQSQLSSLRPQSADASLIKDELSTAIAMASHGTNRLLSALGQGPTRSSLRHDLQAIIARYETLWLQRNRPGGLRESAGQLYGLLAPLMD